MSFLGELFKVISYYTGAETPMANDSILMDTWDELEEEEQRKYLKSLLYGAVIAVTLATGYTKFDVLFGDKLETATDNALQFIKEKGKSYFIGKSMDTVSNDLLLTPASSGENSDSNSDNDNVNLITYQKDERKDLIYNRADVKKVSQKQAMYYYEHNYHKFVRQLKDKKVIILNPAEEEEYEDWLGQRDYYAGYP